MYIDVVMEVITTAGLLHGGSTTFTSTFTFVAFGRRFYPELRTRVF